MSFLPYEQFDAEWDALEVLMKLEITVPSMGESVVEAIVGALLASSGALVEMDQELLELETDKVNQLLFAPQRGRIEWVVKTGDQVKIGQRLGWLESEAQQQPEEAAPSQPPLANIAASSAPKQEEKQRSTKEALTAASEPSLRYEKEQFMADLKASSSQVSQPPERPSLAAPEEGKKRGEERPAIEPSKAPSEQMAMERRERLETRHPMPKIRQVIAQRLVEAQQQSAMLTTFNEVDMGELMQLRSRYQELFQKKHQIKLGMMSFFVKAVVRALQRHPKVNSYIDGTDIVQRHYYDLSIAVSTERGLVVPVLRHADELSFAQIERAISDYAKRAREGKLALEELQGGGFTITNGGVYGSLLSTPLLNPPQCAILGMHAIQKRAVVVDEQVQIRPMMYLALSYDHRLLDGKEAVTFLIAIKELIEAPSQLLFDL